MFNTFLCLVMLRRSMLQVLSWLETACYERFFGKETACYRYCWRKNCHVVKRFADKKQHIRATFCEERAW